MKWNFCTLKFVVKIILKFKLGLTKPQKFLVDSNQNHKLAIWKRKEDEAGSNFILLSQENRIYDSILELW